MRLLKVFLGKVRKPFFLQKEGVPRIYSQCYLLYIAWAIKVVTKTKCFAEKSGGPCHFLFPFAIYFEWRYINHRKNIAKQ